MAQQQTAVTKPAAAPAEDIVKKRVIQFIMAMAGTVLTYSIWNLTPISNIIASAGLALVVGLLFKKHFDIFFCGTFAGMCSIAAIPEWYWVLILGGLVFVFWILLEKLFIGVGGKFGTTAMIAGLVTDFLVWAVKGEQFTYKFLFNEANYKQLDWILWVFGPILGLVACTAMIYIRNKGELVKNTTVASAMIGLLGAFCLLWMIAKVPTSTTVTYGTVLAGVVYTASFAGMASKERLDPCHCFNQYVAFAITGAIAGTLFMAIYGFVLVGGRFGFTGFLAVLIYNKLICPILHKTSKYKACLEEEAKKK